MNIFITGGAGYIGSHTVKLLQKLGHRITVFDNFEFGHREALPTNVHVIRGDLRRKDDVVRALTANPADAVIHFASYIEAGDSMRDPGRFYENNVGGSLNLLSAMLATKTRVIVFSSSAAIYGDPKVIPITENAPKEPTNVYGHTKLIVEEMLHWYHRIHEVRAVSLRYFNAVGCDPEGELGLDHEPETHLIPVALKVALGLRPALEIFGNDYGTPDGTAIRDYVHVTDLAHAHRLALESLASGKETFNAFNLGSETGFSVGQVAKEVILVTGREIPMVVKPRRAGDPEKLIANSAKAREVLGWQPKYSDLRTIIETAWRWHSQHPYGYRNAR
ncbi:MAG: UDP-glucose 4-epimerase GalE [Parcubacteria group bacterium]|nr:UDP-glucose 4-epimerase GalE [Parcubacteria group bacterium]